MLPFASEATLARLEANIGASPCITDLLHQGADASDITQRILAGLGATESGFSLTPRWGPPHNAAPCKLAAKHLLPFCQKGLARFHTGTPPLLLVKLWRVDRTCACSEARYGPCEPESLKERMKRAVALLGAAEVADIMQKEGKIEVRDLWNGWHAHLRCCPGTNCSLADCGEQVSCDFCRETYQFGESEVLAALTSAQG